MSECRATTDADVARRRISVRRVVICVGVGVAVLALGVIAALWREGAEREARAKALLGRFEWVTIEALYGEYRYEPPEFVSVETALERAIGGGKQSLNVTVLDDPPRHLAWLVPVVGELAFARVTEIDVSIAEFSDADVPLLTAFPEVREIDLSNTRITDAGIAQVATLEELVKLDISNTRATPEGLWPLSRCKRLRELTIFGLVTDTKDVAELQRALPDCDIRE